MQIANLDSPALSREADAVKQSRLPTYARMLSVVSAVGGLCVFCLLVLPLLYSELIFNSWSILVLPEQVTLHIYFNCICNLLVCCHSLFLGTDRRRRTNKILTSAVSIHGLFLLSILLSRSYYSRPTLFISLLLSIILATLVARLVDRWMPSKVVILTADPDHEAVSWLQSKFDLPVNQPINIASYDTVIIDLQTSLSAETIDMITKAMLLGKEVRHLAEYVEEVRGRSSIDHFASTHVNLARTQFYQKIKRLVDIIISLGILPIVAPTITAASLAVLLTTRENPFFLQRRIGLGGEVFTIWKLRTMWAHTAEAALTSVGDKRVTPIGKLLRRYRIDELPQVLNVLAGDMSFVGPRPEQPAIAREYEMQMPTFAFRSMVRPGITGWAQIRAPYAANLKESREKLSYDLYYVKNISFVMDLRIVAGTVLTLLFGRGVR